MLLRRIPFLGALAACVIAAGTARADEDATVLLDKVITFLHVHADEKTRETLVSGNTDAAREIFSGTAGLLLSAEDYARLSASYSLLQAEFDDTAPTAYDCADVVDGISDGRALQTTAHNYAYKDRQNSPKLQYAINDLKYTDLALDKAYWAGIWFWSPLGQSYLGQALDYTDLAVENGQRSYDYDRDINAGNAMWYNLLAFWEYDWSYDHFSLCW